MVNDSAWVKREVMGKQLDYWREVHWGPQSPLLSLYPLLVPLPKRIFFAPFTAYLGFRARNEGNY